MGNRLELRGATVETGRAQVGPRTSARSSAHPGAQARAIVLDLDLAFEAGRVHALVGPNGAGKSSCLRFAAGIPIEGCRSSGSATWAGADLLALPPRERARVIAYVGSDLRVDFPLTGSDVVKLGAVAAGKGAADARAREALERVGALGLFARVIGTLSGGERQLLLLARALAQGSPVLAFDETFSRMDLHHLDRSLSLAREHARQGGLVVFVSHDLNLASAFADRVVFLHRGGVLAEGAPTDVLTPRILGDAYPGARLRVTSANAGKPTVLLGY